MNTSYHTTYSTSIPSQKRPSLQPVAFSLLIALVGLADSGSARADNQPGYSPAQDRGLYGRASEQIDLVGDFNGDGMDDAIFFHRSSSSGSGVGDVEVRLGRWKSFGEAEKWHDFFSINEEMPLVGDFNGDGKDDIVTFLRGDSGDVYVALSEGSSFGPGKLWHGAFCIREEIPVVADINGDGKDDVLTFTRGTSKRVFAALSTGAKFEGTGALWHGDFAKGGTLPAAGDFNGDGKDDIIAFNRSAHSGPAEADVVVALSTGTSFETADTWHDYFSVGSEVPRVGDVNGDGKDDILTFTRGSNARYFVAVSSGSGFGPGIALPFKFAEGDRIPRIGQFDQDTASDLVSFSSNPGFGQIKVALSDWNAYAAWSHSTFPENVDVAIVHQDADADRDGWSNLGEFLVDSNPMQASSHPNLRLQVSPQDGQASVIWTERRDRSDYARARPQHSMNLREWRPANSGGIFQDNERATYAASAGIAEGIGYFRLLFEVR